MNKIAIVIIILWVVVWGYSRLSKNKGKVSDKDVDTLEKKLKVIELTKKIKDLEKDNV